jgi:hypothetical protein
MIVWILKAECWSNGSASMTRQSLADALGSRELAKVLDDAAAEKIVFSTPSSAVLRLFDAAYRSYIEQSRERFAPCTR